MGSPTTSSEKFSGVSPASDQSPGPVRAAHGLPLGPALLQCAESDRGLSPDRSLTDWFCERRSGWEENKGRGKEGGPDGQVLPIIMKCVEIN